MSSRLMLTSFLAGAVLMALRPSPAHGQVPVTTLRPGAPRPSGIQAPQVALLPMGISVKMVMGDWLGPGPVHGATAPVSLGMASTFQLDDIPQASNGSGGKPPHGTIKFAATNQQAMLINKCFTPACRATLTITNLTAQGMAVYELRLVRITQVQIGQYVDASFTYGSISWQMYATGSGTPSQTGSWSYTQ